MQEGACRLKQAQLADTDETLMAAVVNPPEKRSHPEVLRRRIESVKAQAQALSARRRFMAGRAEQARLAGPARLKGSDPPQKQMVVDAGEHPAERSDNGQTAPAAADAATLAREGGKRHGSTDSHTPEPAAAEGPRPPPAGGMECPICYESIGEGGDVYVFGACGHSFCRECSAQQVIQSGACALCRTKVTRKQVCGVGARLLLRGLFLWGLWPGFGPRW